MDCLIPYRTRISGVGLGLILSLGVALTLAACSVVLPTAPADTPKLTIPPSPTATPTAVPTSTPTTTATPVSTPGPTATRTPAPSPTQTATTTPAPRTTPPPANAPTPAPANAGAAKSFSPARLAELDQHALNAPKAVEGSVKDLAAYLAQPAKDDFEKTRTIYRWIAQNIAYDAKAFFSKQYGDQSTEAVLRRRTGVCEGYANLFLSLARTAGVEVVKVSGWAKGTGYDLGELSGDTNHAWNAVKIDGAWYLIDSTWGAGHLDEALTFVRQFEPFFWLVPPERLIYTHFPEDSRWQLLSPPVSKAGFAALPELKPGFFDLGLQLPPGTGAVTSVESRASLNITAPTDVLLTVAIEQAGGRLPKAWVFSQRNESTYEVQAVFPGPGKYDLLLFAKRPDNTDTYPGVAVLTYDVKAGEPSFSGFPQTYLGFQQHGVYLYSPLHSKLPVGATQTFKLRIPSAQDAAVIVGNAWTHLAKQGDVFEGTTTVGAGQVQVCARFDAGSSYSCLLSYND